eukprot:9016863-Pyramimonas_sp.AAC.1
MWVGIDFTTVRASFFSHSIGPPTDSNAHDEAAQVGGEEGDDRPRPYECKMREAEGRVCGG